MMRSAEVRVPDGRVDDQSARHLDESARILEIRTVRGNRQSRRPRAARSRRPPAERWAAGSRSCSRSAAGPCWHAARRQARSPRYKAHPRTRHGAGLSPDGCANQTYGSPTPGHDGNGRERAMRKLIAGNWKMNGLREDGTGLAKTVADRARGAGCRRGRLAGLSAVHAAARRRRAACRQSGQAGRAGLPLRGEGRAHGRHRAGDAA